MHYTHTDDDRDVQAEYELQLCDGEIRSAELIQVWTKLYGEWVSWAAREDPAIAKQIECGFLDEVREDADLLNEIVEQAEEQAAAERELAWEQRWKEGRLV